MGLGTLERATYIHVAEGNFRIRTNSEDPNAEARVVENPTTGEKITRYELVFDYLDGYLTKIEKRTHETFGDSFLLTIEDSLEPSPNNNVYKVVMTDSSGYAIRAIQRIPNMDLRVRHRFVPYSIPKGDKSLTGMNIFPYPEGGVLGEKLFSFYVEGTKDSGYTYKHGFPEPSYEQDEKGNIVMMSKDEYEIYKRTVIIFLKKQVVSFIAPSVEKVVHEVRAASTSTGDDEDALPKAPPPMSSDEPDDDLPF